MEKHETALGTSGNPETVQPDPVKELQEICDRKSYNVLYTVIRDNGVPSVVAEVQAEGTTYAATTMGLGKLMAKKLAAQAVLEELKAAER